MVFKQLFDEQTWTYTYLVADPISRQAAFIDPVNTHIDRYMILLEEMGLTLKYSLETHVHADHITASGLLRQKTGAQTGVSTQCGAEMADLQLEDGDQLHLGDIQITVIATPGHTGGSLSFSMEDRVFTGDSLLIDGCGRTDFQAGDAATLYHAITQRLFSLPDGTLVFPGHDYQGRWVSTIAQEKMRNPRLAGKTEAEFITIMDNLNLPNPKLIDEAVPANRYCGLDEDERQDAVVRRDHAQDAAGLTGSDLVAAAKTNITEVTVETAKSLIKSGDVVTLDVREESEYAAGAIETAQLLPRGVLEFKLGTISGITDFSSAVLVYCRTGGRSAMAAQSLQQLGYTNVVSMAGGYEAWVETFS